MELQEHLKRKSDLELEEWFLSGLSDRNCPVTEMLEVVFFLESHGNRERAMTWADLLQDAISERKEILPMIDLLDLKNNWITTAPDPAFRDICKKNVSTMLNDRIGLAFVKSVGFDNNEIDTKECLRRLKILINLKDGTLCSEKTWGFGVVKRIDDFYQKITIDFQNKPGHQMSFTYAAESLEIIGDNHILALKHRQPAEIERLAKNAPDELVRMVLKSFGNIPLAKIKDILASAAIITDADWKPFWENARKILKSDPLIEIPAKKTEPIKVLTKKKEYDTDWFNALKKECDVDKILQLTTELKRTNITLSNEEHKKIIWERLAFVIKGTETGRCDLAIQALITAHYFGSDKTFIDFDSVVAKLISPKIFLPAISSLSVNSIADFLQYLESNYDRAAQEILFTHFDQIPLTALGEVIDFLVSTSRQEQCAAKMKELISAKRASSHLLCWLCRNIDNLESWPVGSVFEIISQAIDALSSAQSGDNLKTQNQIRAFFDQKAWIKHVLDFLNDNERGTILKIVESSKGWDSVEKRSVMAKMISLYPSLEAMTVSASESAMHQKVRFTSWRSYRRRREQLRVLLEETIPANSKEIGVARSYGDLRENFEYQAARDQQRLLLEKKQELEKDLTEVKGTDFSDYTADKAGIGTCVTLKKSSGDITKYCILGEWDHDKELGIISCKSKLALLLKNKRTGDIVELPGEKQPDTFTIIDITGLTEDQKHWIEG